MKTNPTLLYLDASPRVTRSRSRQLGQEYMANWRAAHPNGSVTVRDIGQEPPPFVTESWVEGAFSPLDSQSTAARDAMEVSNRYVDELMAADQLVVTTPVYNLSIPASLKAWIDQIVRVGRTFATTDSGFEGLAKGKTALVIVASGSDFRPETPGGAYNFAEPYLRAVFGFIGITDVRFVYAHSLGNAAAAPATISEAQSALAEIAAA